MNKDYAKTLAKEGRTKWIESANRTMINLSDMGIAEIHYHILMDQIDKYVQERDEARQDAKRMEELLHSAEIDEHDNGMVFYNVEKEKYEEVMRNLFTSYIDTYSPNL